MLSNNVVDIISQACQKSMRLRTITGIRCQDLVPNTEVLRICNTNGIETFLRSAQIRWSGHTVRINDNRLPKVVFYGQLKEEAHKDSKSV